MKELIFRGIGVSDGIRRGKAFIYRHATKPGTGGTIVEELLEAEIGRLDAAVEQASCEIDSLVARASQILPEKEVAVIKGQKTFLTDPAYCPAMRKLMRERLLTPEKAVQEVTERYASMLEKTENPYLRERASDVRDAGSRLLQYLAGRNSADLAEIDSPVILLADDLSPSDTVRLDCGHILAFATQKGGKTSHTSIFAKSLGIPAVVGIPDLLAAAEPGVEVILDGGQGVCILAPGPDTAAAYDAGMETERTWRELLERFAGREARTADGRRIAACANIGSAADAQKSLKMGAEGAGLFRTEQMYLSRKDAPDEESQFAVYKQVAECYGGKTVVVRTLDIGGDKEIPYLGIGREANPFLGFRAIRYCRGNSEIFLTQLRAILRASAYGDLAVMFPMISGLQELLEAKAMLRTAGEQLASRGIPFNRSIKTGIMVEIPSAAVMADILAEEADFFSIGTNDLVQYTLAVDRGNEKVAYLYDYFDPAVVRLIRRAAEAARRSKIPVGLCGAMAGDPLAVPLLVGLGLDELSMAAGALPEVKYIISQLASGDCRKLADSVRTCRTSQQIRAALQQFSSDKLNMDAKPGDGERVPPASGQADRRREQTNDKREEAAP